MMINLVYTGLLSGSVLRTIDIPCSGNCPTCYRINVPYPTMWYARDETCLSLPSELHELWSNVDTVQWHCHHHHQPADKTKYRGTSKFVTSNT